jgi:hypothetical protein
MEEVMLRLFFRFFTPTISNLALLFCLTGVALSQAPPDTAAGVLPFATERFGADIATGRVNLSIAVRNKLGKVPFRYSLEGNFGVYKYEIPSTGGVYWVPEPMLEGGPSQAVAWLGLNSTECAGGGKGAVISDLQVEDGSGALHPVPGTVPCVALASNPYNLNAMTTDGSGYRLVMSGTSSAPSIIIYDSSGNAVNVSEPQTGTWSVTDPDGVAISAPNPLPSTYTDSLGQSARLR